MNNIGEDDKDKLDNLLQKTNTQILIIMFLCFVITILVIGYMNIETKVKVEMPPKFISDNTESIEYEITNDSATSDHFKVWGYYYIVQTATFKSNEIRKKVSIIKKAYEPGRLKKERKELDKQGKEYSTTDNKELDSYIKNIRSEKITQTFEPKKVLKPDLMYGNKEAICKIEGIATQTFEKVPNDPITKDKPCYYKISFKREGGNDYVTSYKTNCFD